MKLKLAGSGTSGWPAITQLSNENFILLRGPSSGADIVGSKGLNSFTVNKLAAPPADQGIEMKQDEFVNVLVWVVDTMNARA